MLFTFYMKLLMYNVNKSNVLTYYVEVFNLRYNG